jgi:uncharacterized membrane protein YkoI
MLAALLSLGSAASAQGTMKEEKPGLLAKAKVTPEAARASALARVQGSTIQDQEIEYEDGKLVYSFDLKVAGKSGIEEVLVDALTGAIVSVEHESPKDEAAEAANEAKKLKAKAKASAKKP